MTTQVDELWLWHRRLGHFNFHVFKIVHQKSIMTNLLEIKEIEGVCQGCMLGKQNRQPFPSGKPWRANKPLELVHIDVCSLTGLLVARGFKKGKRDPKKDKSSQLQKEVSGRPNGQRIIISHRLARHCTISSKTAWQGHWLRDVSERYEEPRESQARILNN